MCIYLIDFTHQAPLNTSLCWIIRVNLTLSYCIMSRTLIRILKFCSPDSLLCFMSPLTRVFGLFQRKLCLFAVEKQPNAKNNNKKKKTLAAARYPRMFVSHWWLYSSIAITTTYRAAEKRTTWEEKWSVQLSGVDARWAGTWLWCLWRSGDVFLPGRTERGPDWPGRTSKVSQQHHDG